MSLFKAARQAIAQAQAQQSNDALRQSLGVASSETTPKPTGILGSLVNAQNRKGANAPSVTNNTGRTSLFGGDNIDARIAAQNSSWQTAPSVTNNTNQIGGIFKGTTAPVSAPTSAPISSPDSSGIESRLANIEEKLSGGVDEQMPIGGAPIPPPPSNTMGNAQPLFNDNVVAQGDKYFGDIASRQASVLAYKKTK